MNVICLLIILATGLVYLDFAIWYSAEMHNLYSDKKRKFRGLLWKLWDWMRTKNRT